MYWPNLKSVAFPVPGIIAGTRIFWEVPGYAHSPFLQNFSWAIIRMDTVIVLEKFEVRSLTHSRDNSDWSFRWGANPQSWEEGGRRGSGMVPFERAKVSSYRLPMETFPLYVRVSEILPLLCSRVQFFPHTSIVSTKFPHVPLGVGGWRLGYEERRC